MTPRPCLACAKPCGIILAARDPKTELDMEPRAFIRIALLLALAIQAPLARADDDWLGGDKRAHFIGGVAVGGIVAASTGARTPGVLAGCAVGVFGELIQAARHRAFTPDVSAKDFAAECAGGVAGAFVGVKLAPDRRVASAHAQSFRDSWTSHDKYAHFAGGLAVSGLVSNYTGSATAGVLSGCGIAVGGELIDAARHGLHSRHISSKDAAVACMGAVTAAFAGVELAPGRIVWHRQF
jgi:hypothetical protein